MLQWLWWLVDEAGMGLGVDLHEGAVVQGREEDSAARMGRGAAQRSRDLQRGRGGGLAEEARLRWQRGVGIGVWRR